jgi:hypothetical protein
MRGLEPLTSCMRSKTPELHNLLNLLQHVEKAWLLISRLWQIFHVLVGFGIIFSHRVSHRRLAQTDCGAFFRQSQTAKLPAFSLFVVPVNIQSNLNVFVTRSRNISLGAGNDPGLAAFTRAKILIHLNLDYQLFAFNSHVHILSHFS